MLSHLIDIVKTFFLQTLNGFFHRFYLLVSSLRGDFDILPPSFFKVKPFLAFYVLLLGRDAPVLISPFLCHLQKLLHAVIGPRLAQGRPQGFAQLLDRGFRAL